MEFVMHKIPKLVCWMTLCLIVCTVSSGARLVAQPEDLPKSPLEAFATRSTAKVIWSKLIGHFESQESRATITALIVEDTTRKPSVMRGLRMDLTHIGATPSCDQKYTAWIIMCKRVNAAIYVEEGRLERVRNGIKRGVQLRPMEFISQYNTNAPGRASTGLIVCGYQFSDRQPLELAELFTRAIAELQAESR
jgi:hypothetical protein